jgi:deoxyinosine 3'endonuclease (endonuclease V)
MLYDAFGRIRYIAGVDCSYLDDRIIGGAVVVIMSPSPVERIMAFEVKFPTPSAEEADAMIAAIRKIGQTSIS